MTQNSRNEPHRKLQAPGCGCHRYQPGVIDGLKRLVFIHVPKTAGEQLKKLFDRDSYRKIVITSEAVGGQKHATLSQIRHRLPPDCLPMCVIRNPFDRLYSFWKHLQRYKFDPRYNEKIPRPVLAAVLAAYCDPDEWVQRVLTRPVMQVEHGGVPGSYFWGDLFEWVPESFFQESRCFAICFNCMNSSLDSLSQFVGERANVMRQKSNSTSAFRFETWQSSHLEGSLSDFCWAQESRELIEEKYARELGFFEFREILTVR